MNGSDFARRYADVLAQTTNYFRTIPMRQKDFLTAMRQHRTVSDLRTAAHNDYASLMVPISEYFGDRLDSVEHLDDFLAAWIEGHDALQPVVNDLRARAEMAERALFAAGYTFEEGASAWKPPVANMERSVKIRGEYYTHERLIELIDTLAEARQRFEKRVHNLEEEAVSAAKQIERAHTTLRRVCQTLTNEIGTEELLDIETAATRVVAIIRDTRANFHQSEIERELWMQNAVAHEAHGKEVQQRLEALQHKYDEDTAFITEDFPMVHEYVSTYQLITDGKIIPALVRDAIRMRHELLAQRGMLDRETVRDAFAKANEEWCGDATNSAQRMLHEHLADVAVRLSVSTLTELTWIEQGTTLFGWTLADRALGIPQGDVGEGKTAAMYNLGWQAQRVLIAPQRLQPVAAQEFNITSVE